MTQQNEKYITGDDGDKEWLCEHGVGHDNNVHTCDGCCSKEGELYKRNYSIPQEPLIEGEWDKKKEMIEFLKHILPYWQSDDLDDYMYVVHHYDLERVAEKLTTLIKERERRIMEEKVKMAIPKELLENIVNQERSRLLEKVAKEIEESKCEVPKKHLPDIEHLDPEDVEKLDNYIKFSGRFNYNKALEDVLAIINKIKHNEK